MNTSDTVGHDVLSLELTGRPRRLPPAFFGFNAASIVQSVNVDALLDPALGDRLRDFPTALIRIPSGTAAQWIDWRTGRFIDEPGSPFGQIPADRRPVTMDDWASLVRRSGAEPVWDLNVLNSTIDEQVAMLDHARGLGLSVRFIELGNELWDPRGPYPTVFPTGADYAARMNEWIPVLRSRFPDARIAVSGADLADETFAEVIGERYGDWNEQVLSSIRGADAIVIHQYWGLPDHVPPGSDVPATLDAGVEHWRRMQQLDLDAVPGDLEVWITEWNQAAHFATDGTQIWAQALSVVAVGMEHMLDPRVRMSLVHNIVDGTGNPHDIGVSTVFPSFTNGEGGTVLHDRTALGHALPLLFSTGAAGSGAGSVVRRLATSDTRATVLGVVVTGDRTTALLLNMTAETLRVNLPRSVWGTDGSRLRAVSVSAAPDSSPGWNTDDHVTRTTTDVDADDATVELPPYSVNRVRPAETGLADSQAD